MEPLQLQLMPGPGVKSGSYNIDVVAYSNLPHTLIPSALRVYSGGQVASFACLDVSSTFICPPTPRLDATSNL